MLHRWDGYLLKKNGCRIKAGLAKNFIEFDKEATRAAFGQVHKAKIKNDDIVACKLQYPDMASAVSADLSQLKMIFSIYQSYNKAIKTDEVLKKSLTDLKKS